MEKLDLNKIFSPPQLDAVYHLCDMLGLSIGDFLLDSIHSYLMTFRIVNSRILDAAENSDLDNNGN